LFHQFIAFSVVVDEQSLNKAAKKLNISQPALSRKMLALETQLGITLFHRDGKRLEVTPLGYELYKQALEIKKLERSIMRTIATFEPTTTPTITIGASLTTLQASFPDLISKLSHAFPNITIKVITGKTHEITELMIAGKVELGLVATVVNHIQKSSANRYLMIISNLFCPKNTRYPTKKAPLSGTWTNYQ
jgi:DNA-binding transcriptional LysR family regulator